MAERALALAKAGDAQLKGSEPLSGIRLPLMLRICDILPRQSGTFSLAIATLTSAVIRRMRSRTMLRLALPGAVWAALVVAPASAATGTVWLCRPGLPRDPCVSGLSTTVYTPSFKRLRVERPSSTPAVDCFYLYGTLSTENRRHATLRITPEMRAVVRAETGRYSQYCRVFVPVYRQVTIPWELKTGDESAADLALPLRDVQHAFSQYLKRYSHGRGFVLIAQAQGSAVMRMLIRREIDGNPVLRRRLVSAIVLGGNVLVRRGSDIGGDFKHIPGCRRRSQLGCVIAFSTFASTPPSDSGFGRVDGMYSRGRAAAGDEVLCTNPAALGGGSGLLDPVFPSKPPPPGTVTAALIEAMGLGALPRPKTVWLELPGAYQARCARLNGAHVLEVRPRGGAPKLHDLTGRPVAGLHTVDANLSLGNLIGIVRTQATAYAHRTSRR
jgi:Protein of unknown function (DUF3089)